MDWFCSYMQTRESAAINASVNALKHNGSVSAHSTPWTLQDVFNLLVIPSICCLGVLGNAASFLVFTYR